MSILIIGGLLALAVVAIVGAVLLGVGEERAEKQRKAESAALLIPTSSASQASDATLPTDTFPSTMSGPLPSGDLRTTRQLAPSLHEDAHVSAYNSGQLSASNEDAPIPAYNSGQWSMPNANEGEYIAILNGQIHAITGELRFLAQKASELEQRLSTLSEFLEGQQYHQNDATAKTPVFRKIEMSSF